MDIRVVSALLVLPALACGSETHRSTPVAELTHQAQAGASAAAGAPADSAGTTGDDSSSDEITFRTEQVSVAAGEERFLCFAQDFDQDAAIDGYVHEAQSFVHHVVLARTLAREPDGLSECDVLFRTTWDPLFITGAGRSELDFPNGLGHKLTKGTQVLAQLHLLNAGESDVTDAVEIKMHRSSASDPTPVGTYVFGTTNLRLPAGQKARAVGSCRLQEDVQIIDAFPHMHRLGRALQFEAGSSADNMQSLFVRDPYDFDDQHAVGVGIQLHAGDLTRVTCDYDNTTDHDVTFGESTNAEMCFFVGFAVGQSDLRTCLPSNKPPML